DAPGKNQSRPQRRCDVKRLVILVKRKLSEKEPAKTNFDAWRGAQPAPQGKVRIRVLNFSSTCRLVDFFFEGAERGPPGRTRGISIKRVALYARPSGLI